MTELQAILEAYAAWRRDDGPAVLATVVRVSGSSYRRPGARMLLLPDGRTVGTVSGGCLEGDVKLRAWRLTADGGPAVVRYDSTSDGEIVWQLGLGCKGVVDVLIERLEPGRPSPALEFLRGCLDTRQPGVLARVVGASGAAGPRVGDYLTRDIGGAGIHTLGDAEAIRVVGRAAGEALEAMRSRNVAFDIRECRVEVFVEVLEPPRSLLLCGAGHDAIPLVRLAKELGHRVTVLDPRPNYATRERFPAADEVVVAAPEDLLPTDRPHSLRTLQSRPPGAGDLAARLDLVPRAAAVILSHNYHNDLRFLRALMPSAVGYLGILGPRNRTEKLLRDLAAEGHTPTRAQLDRLHGPVGLDVGADAPEQIALAVMAEVQAFFARRPGGFLRDRAGTIHDRSAEVELPPLAAALQGVRACPTEAG